MGAPESLAAERSPAPDRIAAELRRAILSGEIGPGERIRQEDVAARAGASRLPVREALRILAAEGLVEHAANKGARVPLLGAREVDLLYQMRERLEPLALAESIPRLLPADLERLESIQRRIERWRGIKEFVDLDRELHLLTYSGCAMQPLQGMVARLWNQTQHYRREFVRLSGPGSRWIVDAEHRLLLDAIRRGDAGDAELHLVGHIRRTRVELARHPEVFAGCQPLGSRKV